MIAPVRIGCKRGMKTTLVALTLSCSIPCFGQAPDSTKTGVDLDALLNMDLERVLEIQSAGRGEIGSFGERLSSEGNKVNVHGYVTNELIEAQNSNTTFDNHYFNVFVGSQISERIHAEIQLEYEHGGEEIQARYAQVDYKVSDALIIRTGKFLVPINTFNEYLYPEYINKTISRPFINRNITPTAWAEVGIQARGQINVSEKIQPFYSVFVVNGLEGAAGGDIRGMRNNHRDKNQDSKAVGGRLGFTSDFGLEAGGGVYTGIYTPDGKDNLFIGAFDAGYVTDKFSVRAEYNMANLQVTDSTGQSEIDRSGASLMATYIIKQRVEPVVRYDFMDWGDDNNEALNKSRIYVGVNYLLSSTANVKAGYEIITNEGTDVDDNVFALQLALGF